MDYKEILRNKANQLRALVAKYGESFDEDTLNTLTSRFEEKDKDQDTEK